MDEADRALIATAVDGIAVLIEMARKEPGLPEFNPSLPCPRCNGATTMGFGLFGGGFGPYTVCDPCGVVVTKSEDEG